MYPKDYDPNMFVSNPGERYKVEFIGEMDENGIINLIKVGETDLWELHQRDAEMNDVNVLYKRFCEGDISVLSQRQGTFMDACGMPRDLRGMYELINGFDAQYERLPDEIKSKYTKERFVSEAGSAQWIKDMQSLTDTAPAAVETSNPAPVSEGS